MIAVRLPMRRSCLLINVRSLVALVVVLWDKSLPWVPILGGVVTMSPFTMQTAKDRGGAFASVTAVTLRGKGHGLT